MSDPPHQSARKATNQVTLFCMTAKGLAVLEQLIASHRSVIHCVIGARDAAMLCDCYDEIKSLCREHGIPWYDRGDDPSLCSKYALTVSWRWMIEPGQTKLIVLHDSLLPKYRGFNPLVTALINGDSEIGVTALFASEEFDSGPIIGQSKTHIKYPITIRGAIDLIAQNYKALAAELASRIGEGEPFSAYGQDGGLATYSLWRDAADYRIEWGSSAATVRRMIDAVGFPYAGASALMDGRAVRVLTAESVDDVNIVNRVCGKVLFVKEGCPIVVCGSGLLKLTSVVDDASRLSVLPLKRFRVRFE